MIKMIAYIFIGGGAGCVLRFLIGKYTLKFYEGSFPVGTLIANIISCVLVGLLVYNFGIKSNGQHKMMYLLLITGLCGGLSTFSTFSFETFELLRQQQFTYAVLNVLISTLLGVAAIYIFYKKSMPS